MRKLLDDRHRALEDLIPCDHNIESGGNVIHQWPGRISGAAFGIEGAWIVERVELKLKQFDVTEGTTQSDGSWPEFGGRG
jgi:hypothetical protein